MAIRKIIKIDEKKCNGCGLCVPNCAEGAIQIIGGKARLVKDSYCDGLGACLGHCPMDALHIIEREADDFDEDAAMEFVKKVEEAKTKANINKPHVHHHGGGCPGSRMMSFENSSDSTAKATPVGNGDIEIKIRSQLKQWPVQLNLVPTSAPFFENAELLVTADCVPFAYPNYHLDLLKGKAVVVGCPKLDDNEYYTEKLTEIVKSNNLKSITVAHMEVPCCNGIVRAVETAVSLSGKSIPIIKVRVGIQGDIK